MNNVRFSKEHIKNLNNCKKEELLFSIFAFFKIKQSKRMYDGEYCMIGKYKERNVVASISSNYWVVGMKSGQGIDNFTKAIKSTIGKKPPIVIKSKQEQVNTIGRIIG